MPTELTVHVVHLGGMRMTASNGTHSVGSDYPLQPGEDAAALKPMELLLASLGTCSGSVVASLLGRAREPVEGVEVVVRGQRRDQHPTVFTAITMEFLLRGAANPVVVERVLQQAEHLCPVWAMLAQATPITTSFRIVDAATRLHAAARPAEPREGTGGPA